MNTFIVYYHPEPQSFNAALLREAVAALEQAGHGVRVSDLHDSNFNPVSGRHNFTTVKDSGYYKQQIEELHATETSGFSAELEKEMQKLEWCDLMIWQFPLWWFGLPGPLKGWVDRVFAMGRTYGNGRFYESGVFIGKRALLSLTTGGPAEAYQADGFNGDINSILRPIQRGMLAFVGFSVLAPQISYGPAHLDQEQRAALLHEYRERLQRINQEEPINVGHY